MGAYISRNEFGPQRINIHLTEPKQSKERGAWEWPSLSMSEVEFVEAFPGVNVPEPGACFPITIVKLKP